MRSIKTISAAVAAAFPAAILISSANAAPAGVSFTSPANGATVSGSVGCQIGGSGIAYTRFYLDNAWINTDTASPFQCAAIDTTKLANGTHTLKAMAYDGGGANVTTQISLNVSNGTATPTPTPTPTGSGLSFTSPAAGATVTGTINCAVNGLGTTAYTRFYIDGAWINTDTAAPWTCSLDTSKLSNGSHSLKAIAYTGGGVATETTIPILVANGGVTPTPTPTPTPSGSLSFTSPASGSTVKGTVNCAVNGLSTTAYTRFYIDGAWIVTDTAAPWTCSLDTTKLKDGSHTLKAMAYTGGGILTETSIPFMVANAGATPTPTPSGLPSTGTKAIATFESIGLYWSPGADPGAAGCTVRYRKASESAWKDGLAMWYDARNSECRGSLVHLAPGTSYVVQMGLPGQSPSRELTASTWNESLPIASTVTVPSQSATLTITQGGSPGAYVLYTAAAGGSTIDVANNADYNVVISAPYVILRGFTLKGARINGIQVTGGTDIVIENNDISNWGRSSGVMSAGGYLIGTNMDSGISARCSSTFTMERSIIQRNKIHDPRYGAQSWSEGHPSGPNAVFFSECGGNHVFRYNEIWGSYGHKYMDAYGGEENFGLKGMPNADSDLYGNRIQDTQDDAIESEGANRNVRVWGNYFNNTGTGVATTATSVGPIYIWRNVMNRSRNMELAGLDADQRLYVFKSGQDATYGNGRRYVFHNTILQTTQAGLAFPLGAGEGLSAPSDGAPMTNTVSRNNIFHIWKSWWNSADAHGGTGDDFDYDLFNGNMVGVGPETHGIVGTPTYAAGNGPASDGGGLYQLDPSSPGYDQGARIPNFNDDFTGAAPDIGAHEAGKPAMKFGVQ